MSIAGWLSDMILDGAAVLKASPEPDAQGRQEITLSIPSEKIETAFTMAHAKRLAQLRGAQAKPSTTPSSDSPVPSPKEPSV